MDTEGHDRQSGCGRVCGKSGAVRGVRVYEPASGYYLFSWMRSGICHRNFMGNLWYSDPIVVSVFANSNPQLMIISISACMAGAVCGDHCSPISDTTIMASAGAQCDHVNHVSTQLPYAITAAAVSFISYIIAGFVQTALIALPIAILLMLIVLVVIKMINKPIA